MLYGVANDYEYSLHRKRERLTIWSGSFFGSYEGDALSLPNGAGYMVTTRNGDKVRVECPTPRNDATYNLVDSAINDALNKFYEEGN